MPPQPARITHSKTDVDNVHTPYACTSAIRHQIFPRMGRIGRWIWSLYGNRHIFARNSRHKTRAISATRRSGVLLPHMLLTTPYFWCFCRCSAIQNSKGKFGYAATHRVVWSLGDVPVVLIRVISWSKSLLLKLVVLVWRQAANGSPPIRFKCHIFRGSTMLLEPVRKNEDVAGPAAMPEQLASC